ncbi:DUF3888 domain-containing protein [Heyndrickxia oleronia]|uniref:DUF3888 domain-containing protein n=1 Tax=Heyndrickxia oleronia TaxID=38875 RepID=A0A8E2IA52_9BACI|nr:DUF3888 domain-containing protein [Heyndrickxia oleronia]MEC1373954.1 DUF3888 domain-containing protein [Heyndrickxia oleronia]OJH17582.1 hypothetical protein BLX88_17150 [Bacillus obstructivus]OOP69561.1 hypothetical protein BWZ43_04500 [Heyndrickxia oleronia]QQZ03582.1 DUF3888 domain-containing protein [Heyndrickxia oleronia]
MRPKLTVISVIILVLMSILVPYNVHATVQKGNNDSKDFDIDLTGYQLYAFGDFNQLGYKITPLAQLYFTIIQLEEEWIDEPRLYIKGNKGFIHLWKKDGTNVLYTVEKQTSGPLKDMWKIVDVKRKKINRIPVPKELLKEALIERLVDPISKAIETNYKPKLWYRGFEKILKIERDEENSNLNVTVQVQTFEGAHNPPYGEETITFQIRGSQIKVVDYKHRDIPKKEWTKLELRNSYKKTK